MKKAGLYVRVSTEEQKKHGLSVDNQIQALEEYARQQGYFIEEIYNDAGISAAKSYKKRPELLRMIADCKAKKIDIVLFTRLDRFFRSVPDYYACIEQMEGTPWRAIWEDYETETSAGVFKVNIMLSIAQAEASRTSEKIKSVFDYKVERGDYIGTPPFGYRRVDHRTLEKDPEQAPAIEALFKNYLKTYSTSEAKAAAAKEGLVVSSETIRNMLRNTSYAGTSCTGAKVPAYITPEEHLAICESIKKRARPQQKTGRIYLFTGLIFCKNCGGRYTVLHTAKKYGGYTSYRCRNPHHKVYSITEIFLERFLLNTLEKQIASQIESAKTKAKSHKKANEKSKKSIEARLQRLLLLFEEGDLDLDTYRAKRDALKRELEELKTIPTIPGVELPPDWRTIYNQLDREHQRAFWLRIIREIKVEEGNKERIEVSFW